MDEKYKKAIIVGLACGIILVILTLITTVGVRFAFGNDLLNFVQQYSSPESIPSGTVPEIPSGVMIAGIVSLIMLVLGILTFFLAGVLAAMRTAPFLKTRNDVLMVGAIAGAVAEIVHRPFAMILTMLMDIIKPMTISTAAGSTVSDIISTAIGQLVCCFPFVLVCGIILALLGALLYGMLKLKL